MATMNEFERKTPEIATVETEIVVIDGVTTIFHHHVTNIHTIFVKKYAHTYRTFRHTETNSRMATGTCILQSVHHVLQSISRY